MTISCTDLEATVIGYALSELAKDLKLEGSKHPDYTGMYAMATDIATDLVERFAPNPKLLAFEVKSMETQYGPLPELLTLTAEAL